jgi:hypothetical protein
MKLDQLHASLTESRDFWRGVAISTAAGAATLGASKLADKLPTIKPQAAAVTTAPTTPPVTFKPRQTAEPAGKPAATQPSTKPTARTPALPAPLDKEFATIAAAARRNGLSEELFPVLLAMRKAENGGPGVEFGVLHPRAKGTNLDTQAGWAAATLAKNYQRWLAQGGKKGDIESFIPYFQKVYAPVGVSNDPNNLNNNWAKNVIGLYRQFKSLRLPDPKSP